MTSVLNPRQQLSGNKWLFLVGALMLAGCSPKISRPSQVVAPIVTTEKHTVKKQQPKKVDKKPVEPKVSTIAMLLPFNLDHLNAGMQYTPGTLNQANMSLDYYQGFKFALDSLTNLGYNYKLQLLDSKEKVLEARNLAYNAFVRTSDLIVGPVFPEDMQAFINTLSSTGKSIPTVSPLSPSSPVKIKNDNLVTIATPLEYHALSAAQYIIDNYKPKNVFILQSGSSEENNYVISFKKGIDSLGKYKIKAIATIVSENLNNLLPQLSLTEENIFVIPATNEEFLTGTLHLLDLLPKKYQVIIFGHPNWVKLSYLQPDILQRLKAHITSTDKIDYKSVPVINFIDNYCKIYQTEPTLYSLMGFDEGIYLGTLLGKNPELLKKLNNNDFSGLLNQYHFIKKPGLGWINVHTNILQYDNFELKKVE